MKYKQTLIISALLLCMTSCSKKLELENTNQILSDNVENTLPNPEPFLESSGSARQDPVLVVKDFAYHVYGAKNGALYEQPSFVVGNKAVAVRMIDGRNRPDQDQSVTIYIDNKQVGRFMWWGAFKGGGFGYPFKDLQGDPASLDVDKENKTITYSKPYLTPEGKRALFTYTIKSLKDSKIELSWNLGVTQKELDDSKENFTTALWFSIKDYKGKKIIVGDTEFKEASRDELIANKVSTSASGDFVYNASAPLQGYTLGLFDLSGQITESITVPKVGDDRYNFIYRLHAPKRQVGSKIIIDLGEAALPQKDTPPLVGGIDFWKIDGTHVPLSPTRNVMRNPSFEQGLRYWTWVGGGATYTPDDLDRYEVVPQGKFGKNAVILRSTQPGAPGMRSFPMSLDKGQVYTLSFYAKAAKPCGLTVALASAARGGKFQGKYGTLYGDTNNPDSKFKLTTQWKRYSRTITADSGGVCICLFGGSDTLIDGIQLEKGDKPTKFVCAPLDGNFTTSDKDNSIVKGQPIDAGFTFTGQPGVSGEVTITAKNAFKEIVYSGDFDITIGPDGTQKILLPFDAQKFGEGIFVIKTECNVKGFEPYSDYYRLFIMTPLTNTHATKDIFGTLGQYARISRGDDLAQKYKEWGFGSTSWTRPIKPGDKYPKYPVHLNQMRNNKIRNFFSGVSGSKPGLKGYRSWKEVSPEREIKIEEAAFQLVDNSPLDVFPVYGFGNEEEGSYLVRNKKFDEYFKAQHAAAKGIKRANPKAIVVPTCGTSGYSRLRGYDAMEGYLKAASEHNFKYDAIAVHPYGNIDKGILSENDLDEETARLIAQMKRYGYGKETPIYYTECFNKPEVYIPAWGAGTATDYYQSGKPTYDFGNREFIHAASAARLYIIALKYWPQVQSVNIWASRPFMDQNLTPFILCKAVNTLGTNLGYVEYKADIKPAAGVRGYAFKLKDGTGIAPIWCVNRDVENGFKRGPELEVKFGQPVRFIDLMGNERFAPVDKNGITKIQLTPAPLLIKAKDVNHLAKALHNAVSTDASSSVKVSCVPDLNGKIKVMAENLTGRVQSGKVSVNGKKLDYTIPPEESLAVAVLSNTQAEKFGKMYKWKGDIKIDPSEGDSFQKEWKMDYFYVPETSGTPDWENIPSIPMTNRYKGQYSVKKADGKGSDRVTPEIGYPGDLDADFKMAWDKHNLYLRVEVEDDHFLTFPEVWQEGNAYKLLYLHDGCLEVYFDTGADGRMNEAKTYDNNDYRYDFSIGKSGKSGPGMVYRLREVDHQLADGVNMASKEEAAKKIKCNFQRTAKGYIYTITFGQRYLEPIVLEKGFTAGFGMFLHDRDDPSVPPGIKGLSLATESGSPCDYNPQLWPLMILSDH